MYPIDAPFVRIDQTLLATFCDVIPFHFRGAVDYPRLLRAIPRADIVFCWFALDFVAVATLVAKLTSGKSIVVAGGWDVTGIPEIQYGRLLYARGRLQARTGLRLADRVLAFSDWSEAAIRKVSPRAKVRRLYLGVDLDLFRPGIKEDMVLCVSNISRENIARKGLRTFVRAAAEVPEARFVLAGRWSDGSVQELSAIAPSNLEITGWLSDVELRDLFSRARVYVQASYIEGFGMAIAEAMAAGCVPVVTRAGSIPEVVGDVGLYAPYGDAREFAMAIRTALRSKEGENARNRVARLFQIRQRAEGLRTVIEELFGRARGSPDAPGEVVTPVRMAVGP